MKQEIRDGIYYLMTDNGKVLLKIRPIDFPGYQVEIETEKEVYVGPISLISFDPNPKK